MKNLATLALLGLVSADQIVQIEDDVDGTICGPDLECPLDDAVCCTDSLTCCPGGYVCMPGTDECAQGDERIPTSLLQKPKKVEYD